MAHKPSRDDRPDNNRTRRLEAIRALDRLIAALCSPSFDGSALIEVHAKKGRMGRVVATLRTFEGEADS